jgi:hypothetical protein
VRDICALETGACGKKDIDISQLASWQWRGESGETSERTRKLWVWSVPSVL